MGFFLIPDKAFSKIVASLTINLQSQTCRDELVEFVSQCIDITDLEKKNFMQGRGESHLTEAARAMKQFDEAVATANSPSMQPAAVRQRQLRAKKRAKTKAKKVEPLSPAPPLAQPDGLTVQQF